jgi:hypothetical protein
MASFAVHIINIISGAMRFGRKSARRDGPSVTENTVQDLRLRAHNLTLPSKQNHGFWRWEDCLSLRAQMNSCGFEIINSVPPPEESDTATRLFIFTF